MKISRNNHIIMNIKERVISPDVELVPFTLKERYYIYKTGLDYVMKAANNINQFVSEKYVHSHPILSNVETPFLCLYFDSYLKVIKYRNDAEVFSILFPEFWKRNPLKPPYNQSTTIPWFHGKAIEERVDLLQSCIDEVTEQMVGYYIMSPDRTMMNPQPVYLFSELKQLWKDIKKRYEMQGYYSSVDYGRIELDVLYRYCTVITVP